MGVALDLIWLWGFDGAARTHPDQFPRKLRICRAFFPLVVFIFTIHDLAIFQGPGLSGPLNKNGTMQSNTSSVAHQNGTTIQKADNAKVDGRLAFCLVATVVNLLVDTTFWLSDVKDLWHTRGQSTQQPADPPNHPAQRWQAQTWEARAQVGERWYQIDHNLNIIPSNAPEEIPLEGITR